MTLPEEFTTYTRALMGEERFARFLGALDEPAPVSIRVNPFKAEATPETGTDRVAWCRGGYYLDSRPAFTFDPLLHAGAYYVQEASSMFIDHVVRQFVHAPVTALDLCAAPGGKTTCLRAALPKGSRLYSNEPHPKRAQILAENIVKFGHPEVVVTNNYAIDYQRAGLRFGLILADMPCSGEGMFRKDPESIGEWSPANVEKCAALQRSILADIWPCLLPGGLLIYSTCTFNAHENEDNIAFTVEQLGAEPVAIPVEEAWRVTGALTGCHPICRFIPGTTRGEGLAVALLRKPETAADLPTRDRGKGRTTPLLRVLSDGVKPPQVKGKKTLPDVSQALTILAETNPYPRVDVDYDEAIAYLRRESITLPAAAPKGLVTVCHEGFALGFAKNLGTRANNLYPQEWRIRSTHRPEERPVVGLTPIVHP